MKFLISFIVFTTCIVTLSAQSFETKFSKSYNSSYCNSETTNFSFYGGILKKIDVLNSESEEFASKLENSNFDENGYYYEVWSPSWYLNNYGVQNYNKIPKRAYKLLFKSKGGNLLYIYEFDLDEGSRSGRFYFTENGRELFCK